MWQVIKLSCSTSRPFSRDLGPGQFTLRCLHHGLPAMWVAVPARGASVDVFRAMPRVHLPMLEYCFSAPHKPCQHCLRLQGTKPSALHPLSRLSTLLAVFLQFERPASSSSEEAGGDQGSGGAAQPSSSGQEAAAADQSPERSPDAESPARDRSHSVRRRSQRQDQGLQHRAWSSESAGLNSSTDMFSHLRNWKVRPLAAPQASQDGRTYSPTCIAARCCALLRQQSLYSKSGVLPVGLPGCCHLRWCPICMAGS